MFPGGFGGARGFFFILLAVITIWLASGFYRVQADEQGVVLRFGAFDRTTSPGWHYHVPAPFETVLKPKVTTVNQINVGFQFTGLRDSAVRQIPEESLMLTGDENIVDINFTVQWFIKDAQAYLFNIRAPEATVKAAAESAMREIIGQTPITDALAQGKGKIAQAAQDLLQRILDSYGAGIQITQIQLQKVDPPAPVIDAFRDVQRALADQQRLQNEAEGYRNDIIPRARGQAEQILQQAEAYKREVVARAEGDAKRFTSVEEAYEHDKDVTLQRLYLETMEGVLKNSTKVVIDRDASKSGVIPYLPLPELKPRAAAPSQPEAPVAIIPPATSGATETGQQPERGGQP
jgi:membrane protease subunit HflK